MSRASRSTRITTSALIALLVCAAGADAQGTSSSLSFEALNRSMWSSGGAGAITFQEFIGTSWNESARIGGIVGDDDAVIIPGGCFIWCWDDVTGDTRTGAILEGKTNGTVGVNFGAKLNPGTVDIIYPGEASITSTNSGMGFTLQSSFAADNLAAQMTTNFASFEAYVDLVFDVYAGGTATGCFFLAGCASTTATFMDVNKTVEIASINRDGSNSLRAFGQDVPFVNFGDEVPVGPVDITVNLPNLETEGSLDDGAIESSGQQDILSLGMDVPAFVADLVLPGSSYLLGGSVAGVDYTVFGSSIGPTLGIGQNFFFEAIPMVTLQFDRLVKPVFDGIAQSAVSAFTMKLGDAADFLFDSGWNTTVTPYYWLDNTFSVDTDVFARLDMSVEFLSLSSALGSIGPVYQTSMSTPQLAFNVDSRSFEMDFAQIQGGAFTVTNTAATPEPVTMVLLGTGLSAVAAARRRNRPGT